MKYRFPELPAEIIKCHAEKCPVCNGHTTVNYGKQTCKSCQGKGYVIIPNKIDVAEGTE